MNYIIQSGDYVVEISSDSIEYHKKKESDIPTFIFPPTKGISDSLKDFKSNLENTSVNIYQLLDNCSSEERLNIINYCIDKELNQKKIVQLQLVELKNNLQLIRTNWYIENLFADNNPNSIYLKMILLNNLIKETFISIESLTLPGIEKVQNKIHDIIFNMQKLIDIIQKKILKRYHLELDTYQIDTFNIEEQLQNITLNNETFNTLIEEIDKILNNRNEWDKIDDSKTILLEDKILVHANESLPAKEPPVSESSIDESLLITKELTNKTSLKPLYEDNDSIDALFNAEIKPQPVKEEDDKEEIKEIKKNKKVRQIINPLNTILDDGYKACTIEIDNNGCLIPANEDLLNIRNSRAIKVFNEREKLLTKENLVNKALVLQTDEERIIHALYDIKIAKSILDLSYVPIQTIQAFPFIKEKYDKKYKKILNTMS